MAKTTDYISPDQAETIQAMLVQRVQRTPDACAYKYFDQEENCWKTINWRELLALTGRWQEAFRHEGLRPGDRVAIMIHNRLEWVAFDLAALGLGLVTVPLYAIDRSENFAFIIEQTSARLLMIEGIEHWQKISEVQHRLDSLKRIISLVPSSNLACDRRLCELKHWLPASSHPFEAAKMSGDSLATIIYTSGTTGNPKGVMLSHRNILSNAFAGVRAVPVFKEDLFLSFLPLSHALERTVGYYLPIMAGASVAHVRSIEKLADDLKEIAPTVLISVPSIFERVYHRINARLAEGPFWKRIIFKFSVFLGWYRFEWSQSRKLWTPLLVFWPILDRIVAKPIKATLGGQLRVTISGGASLNPQVSKVFLAYGINILQGYGLTETSPIISVNRIDNNLPETVGPPLKGVEIDISDNGELLVKGSNVMMGYWQNPKSTNEVFNSSGWLHTGDLARIYSTGHILITGRSKEVIVLSNGEKVSPVDMEQAISDDPLFAQTMVYGEGRPYLVAIVVLNKKRLNRLLKTPQTKIKPSNTAQSEDLEALLLRRMDRQLAAFPGYAAVRRTFICKQSWEIRNGLLTATHKLKRDKIVEQYQDEINQLYLGH